MSGGDHYNPVYDSMQTLHVRNVGNPHNCTPSSGLRVKSSDQSLNLVAGRSGVPFDVGILVSIMKFLR